MRYVRRLALIMVLLVVCGEIHLPIKSLHHQTGFCSFVNLATSFQRFFVCHHALIPNYKFALLQHFGHCRISRKDASWCLIYLHGQRQLECGMSCLAAFQQCSCNTWRSKCKYYTFCDRIVAKINDIKNVFPVPPGVSKKKKIRQFHSSLLSLLYRRHIFVAYLKGTVSFNASESYWVSRLNSWLNASCIGRLGVAIPSCINPLFLSVKHMSSIKINA